MDEVPMDRFPMEPPDASWEAANPGWQNVAPDDPRWRPDRKDKAGNIKPPKDKGQSATTAIHIVNPVNLATRPVPRREWIVDDWLPVGCVTVNYGDGGTGKTLLAQMLMTSTVTGGIWCGREVMRCRSFGLFCEDDEGELHRRQVDICEGYGVNLGDLEAMRWVSGVGQDNALMTFEGCGSYVTPLYEAILKAAVDHRARLVVLDTAADLFAGNENDRHQVRRFIGQLNRLAIDIGGAVLLNAHPSRTGLSTGNLDGGSTAWSNSVRSRWSLARPAVKEGDQEDPDARVLTRRKANYARIGEDIVLRWEKGVLMPLNAVGTATGPSDRAVAEIVFLALLASRWEQGVYVSHNNRAGNYAPKVFGKCAERRGYGVKDFEGAMGRLFDARRIMAEPYGRNGDARQRIAVAPNATGGADEG